MSRINNMTFSYQEYHAYQQQNRDCSILGKSYSMIAAGTGQSNSMLLGSTVIKDPASNAQYELKAEYAHDFTQDMPFIKVTLGTGTETIQEYHINIEEVDVHDASEIEMFALLSYVEPHESSMGFSASIWDTLTGYVENSVSYSKLSNADFSEKPYEWKLNWNSMVEGTKAKYIDAGLYKQVMDGNKLVSLFEQYGRTETVEMRFMDKDHWLPAVNTFRQYISEDSDTWITFFGNGVVECYDSSYDYYDEEKSKPIWSMRVTQEQLAKIEEMGEGGNQFFPSFIGDKDFWEKYLNSDITLEDLKDTINLLNNQSTYDKLLERLPASIKEMWENAVAQMKEKGFHMEDDGELLSHTEFARRYIMAYVKGESIDILGETVESILKFAKESLERLESEDMRKSHRKFDFNIVKLKENEKIFYRALIESLGEAEENMLD